MKRLTVAGAAACTVALVAAGTGTALATPAQNSAYAHTSVYAYRTGSPGTETIVVENDGTTDVHIAAGVGGRRVSAVVPAGRVRSTQIRTGGRTSFTVYVNGIGRTVGL